MRKDTLSVVVCLLATLTAKIESSPKAVIEKVYELNKKGIDVGGIYFYLTAGGIECPSIRGLLHSFYLDGLLSRDYPTILITPVGLKKFKKMIEEFSETDLNLVSRVAGEVGIELSEIENL